MQQFPFAEQLTYQLMQAITPKYWSYKDLLIGEPIVSPAYRVYRTIDCAEWGKKVTCSAPIICYGLCRYYRKYAYQIKCN